jgi:hypothetical protein
MERLEPPALETIEHMDVLTNYGQTMMYIQEFELAAKNLLLMVRMMRNKNEKIKNGLTTDISSEDFWSRLPKTLRPIMDKLDVEVCQGMLSTDEDVGPFLPRLVEIRNRLAHSYLVENSILFGNAEGRRLLVAELRMYSRTFMNLAEGGRNVMHSLILKFPRGREALFQMAREYHSGGPIEQAALEALTATLAREGMLPPDPLI